MSITHHPADTALAAFASCTLDEARALMIATHVSLCAECRKAVRTFEQVGGALLDRAALTDMSTGALERAMAELEGVEMIPVRQVPRSNPLRTPLALYDLSAWHRIGRGMQWRSVSVGSAENYRVFLLKAEPKVRLPRHRHTHTEWTCVLEGAFRQESGWYGPGDFDESDETVEHSPVVEDGAPCICLVALKGRLEFQSWIGRLVQPFIGF